MKLLMKKQSLILTRWKNISVAKVSTSLGLAMFATSAAIFTPPSNAEVEKAKSANSFVDSIGVVVHLNYSDSPYEK